MAILHSYTTTTTLGPLTASLAVTASAWGAGGAGNLNGQGGSGAAFAQTTMSLAIGSTITITVGQPTATDGGASSITSGSNVLLQAPGGFADGTVSGQATLLTGSAAAFLGGPGGTLVTGYDTSNGSGGGSSAGPTGAGTAGSTNALTGASYSQAGMSPIVSNTDLNPYASPEVAPLGGVAATGGANGGNGGYYLAQTDAGLIPAQAGSFPGGGGGGSYTEDVDSAAGAGAVGLVTLLF